MKLRLSVIISGSLSLFLCFCAFFLSSGMASAEIVNSYSEVDTDYVMASVPASCSMTASGMNSHTATVPSGTVNSSIGETTINVFCNDYEGFAVYAIGYTDDTNGNNVLTNSEIGSTYDIETGLATSGNTSNWAMKLSTITSPTPTYPITIESDQSGSFSSFHAVPDDYTKVAKRTSATDVGQNAEGSTIKTTYQAYVSVSQLTGTYTGKVKYLLVHPNYVDKSAFEDNVTVVFDGNGLTFPDGSTTNTVKYANVCKPGGTGYVGTNYQEVMSSNILTGGTQNGAYTTNETVLQPVTITGADKLKVVVNYGITSGIIVVIEGNWSGGGEPDNYEIVASEQGTGTKTVLINSDTVTLYMYANSAPETGYDYGMYAKIYPVYDAEQPNTTMEDLPVSNCTVRSITGSYAETNPWKGLWLYEATNTYIDGEENLSRWLKQNYDSLKGTVINLRAYNPYTLKYDGNGASNTIGMGTHHYYGYSSLDYWNETWQDELSLNKNITLLAPNYKRPGYGFIGWSTDANAASHINTATIYGPNQSITISQGLINQANSSHEIILYAIWLPSAGNIQNWSGCSSMSIGDTTALTDTRDSDTYAVAKLADGNCWMIENLRLGGYNPMTLTTTDTQSSGTLPATSDTNWQQSSSYTNVVQQIATFNKTIPDNTVDRINQKNYAYGNYYSWYAAVNRDQVIQESDTGNVTSSICPKKWGIPSDNDYSTLISALNAPSTTEENDLLREFPANIVLGGFVSTHATPNNYSHTEGEMFFNYFMNDGRIVNGKASGFYWTSSVIIASKYDTREAAKLLVQDHNSGNYELGYITWGVSHKMTGDLAEGYSIRCMFVGN